MEARRKAAKQFLAEMETMISEKLKENGIDARVESRIKRLYTIYQKLQRQRITVDQVYDLLRHAHHHEVGEGLLRRAGHHSQHVASGAGRIKDFIAMPRPNLYQSLHTTVIAEDGHAVRSADPHGRDAQMAEEGIAAHWKYKDGPISREG